MIQGKYEWWILLVLVSFFVLFLWGVGKVIHAEGLSYPEATRDLTVIETWQDGEVFSFAEDLRCFSILLDEEFDKKYPEMSEFCNRLTAVWKDKYKEKKRKKVNLELFNSIDK